MKNEDRETTSISSLYNNLNKSKYNINGDNNKIKKQSKISRYRITQIILYLSFLILANIIITSIIDNNSILKTYCFRTNIKKLHLTNIQRSSLVNSNTNKSNLNSNMHNSNLSLYSKSKYLLTGNIDEINYYYITVFIGSHKQPQALIIDTGSPLTTFPCKSICDNCGTHVFKTYEDYNSKNFDYTSCSLCSDIGKCEKIAFNRNTILNLNDLGLKSKYFNSNELNRSTSNNNNYNNEEINNYTDNDIINSQNLNFNSENELITSSIPKNKFINSSSSTCKFSISYAEGSSYSGYLAFDSLSFKESINNNSNTNDNRDKEKSKSDDKYFTLHNYQIGCVKNENAKLYSQIANGILGLSMNSFFEDLKNENMKEIDDKSNKKSEEKISIEEKQNKGFQYKGMSRFSISLFKDGGGELNIDDNEEDYNRKITNSLINNTFPMYDENNFKLNIEKIQIGDVVVNMDNSKEDDVNKTIYNNEEKELFTKGKSPYNIYLNDKNNNNRVSSNLNKTKQYAIIDSGSTLTLFPNPIAKEIFKMIQFYCSDLNNCYGLLEKTNDSICFRPSLVKEQEFYDSMPNIYLYINNTDGELTKIIWKPQNYLIPKLHYNNNYYPISHYDYNNLHNDESSTRSNDKYNDLFDYENNEISYCLGFKESNHFILGASFMVGKTIGFDIDNKTISIKDYKSITNTEDDKNKHEIDFNIRKDYNKNLFIEKIKYSFILYFSALLIIFLTIILGLYIHSKKN